MHISSFRGPLAIAVSLLLLGAGCSSSNSSQVSVTPEPAPSVTEPAPAPSPSTNPASDTTPAPAPVPTPVAGAPIEYKDLGVDPANSKYGLFQIKVLTDKKINSVQIDFEGFDAADASTRKAQTTWQNIVNGEQLPIEKGKTYQGRHIVGAGAVTVKSSVFSVNFEDGTSWSP